MDIFLDVFDKESRGNAVKNSDIVVSMLPARFHIEVAKDCITYKTHMVTASYVSPEMQQLDIAAKENGLIFMNEIGLDKFFVHADHYLIDRFEHYIGHLFGRINDLQR